QDGYTMAFRADSGGWPDGSPAGVRLAVSVQHEVDDHPRYRHVEPDREGPGGDPPMSGEVLLEGPVDRHHRQGNDQSRQDGVADQDREIDRPQRPLPPVGGRSQEM